MKTLTKLLKWIGILLLIAIIWIFWLYLYWKATQYIWDDLNIPKDFFHTRNHIFSDKIETEENWLDDFLVILESFTKQTDAIWYYDSKYKCEIHESKSKNTCKMMDELLKKDFWNNKLLVEKKMKNYFNLNKLKSNKLRNKDFISLTEDYLTLKDYDRIWWDASKFISYTGLIQYTRALSWLAYEYFSKWETEKALKIILSHQEFINYLENKFDTNLIWSLSLITIDSINTSSLEYFIENSSFSNKQNLEIKKVIESHYHKWLIDNWLKHEYQLADSIINNIKKSWEKLGLNAKEKLWVLLLFLPKENSLIQQKYTYDLLTKKGDLWEREKYINSLPFSISNYFWKVLFQWQMANYKKQYEKEYLLSEKKNNILKLLK